MRLGDVEPAPARLVSDTIRAGTLVSHHPVPRRLRQSWTACGLVMITFGALTGAWTFAGRGGPAVGHPEATIPPGKAVVGAVLAPGELPVAVRAGDRVMVVDAGGDTVMTIAVAEVWAVESVPAPTPATWVSLLVDAADHEAVTRAAATDRLRLGLVAS